MANASIILSLIFSFVGCLVSGQKLVLTHAPSYVTVQHQSKPLPVSHVSNVITDSLGLTSSQATSWQGLKSNSMFKRPKANVLVTVVLPSKTQHKLSIQSTASFPVESDVPVLDMTSVMNSIQSSFLQETPLMVDLIKDSNLFDVNTPNDIFLKLSNSISAISDRLLDSDSVLSKFAVGTLNSSLSPDMTLLSEIQMVDNIMNTLKAEKSKSETSSGKTPDLFSFTLTGLKGVSQTHGAQSQQVKDGHDMISQFIDKMTEDFRSLYKDNVMVQVLAVPDPDKALVRKGRSLLQTTPSPTPAAKNYNLAWDYHDDFPAMFNIILWLVVVLIITVFVIAYGMWNIDPGRDSIIYRMTAQRLKKD